MAGVRNVGNRPRFGQGVISGCYGANEAHLLSGSEVYESCFSAMIEARRKYLMELQLFPMLAALLDGMDPTLPKTSRTIVPDRNPGLISRLRRRLLARVRTS